MWVASCILHSSIVLLSGCLRLSFSPSHIFCLHMSGIQVVLHCLWEQEDKWRCATLYFHVRIFFFHLIGLSSNSMRCRQWGNRKWNEMHWTGDEARTRDEGWGGMKPDCWWSLMKLLTAHKRMSQTENPECGTTWWIQEDKKGEGRREKKKPKTHYQLPAITFLSFVSQNEPNQKNLHVEKHSLSLSFLPSCLLIYSTVPLSWDCMKNKKVQRA